VGEGFESSWRTCYSNLDSNRCPDGVATRSSNFNSNKAAMAELSPVGVSSVVPNNAAHALLMERNRANTQCHHHARMRDTVFAVRRHRVSPSQLVGVGSQVVGCPERRPYGRARRTLSHAIRRGLFSITLTILVTSKNLAVRYPGAKLKACL
jgi:hypothetical protein